MAIIIEQLNRQGDVTALHKFETSTVSLGRGYDNDVIVLDPYVSAHHAQLQRQEHGWTLVDLASENGSFDKTLRAVQQQTLQSGDSFYLAEMQFRLVDSQHPVAATVPLNRTALRLSRLGHPLQLVLWFLLVFAFDLAEFWFNSGAVEEPRWQQQLVQLPLYAIALMVWPTCLMIWARFQHRHGYFRPQLALMLLATLAFSLWQLLAPWLRFNLDGPSWIYWLDQAVTAAVLFGLLLANFTLALQQSALRKVLICAGVVLLFSGQSVVQRLWEQDNPQLVPHFDEVLLSSPFYLSQPLAADEALLQSQQLFEAAAANRQKDSK